MALGLFVALGAHEQSTQRLVRRGVIRSALEQFLQNQDRLGVVSLISDDQREVIVRCQLLGLKAEALA